MTAEVIQLRNSRTGLGAAVERFLNSGDFTDTTRRVYRRTLAALAEDLGADRELPSVTSEDIEDHLQRRYRSAAPATYNRNRATISSLFEWAIAKRLSATNPVVGIGRRKERVTAIQRQRSIVLTYEELQRIAAKKHVSLRERTLWTLLYDSAARAEEVLNLNIEDLDLDERRARITGKGGHAETIHWATATARLLPRLIAGRQRGPVFLTDRRTRQAVAKTDLDPASGKARLSYRRAAELFKETSGGRTLHEIRHARITHLVQDGVDISLVAAKSRHTTLRSLQRYVHPNQEDVAKLTARHDPAARRRS